MKNTNFFFKDILLNKDFNTIAEVLRTLLDINAIDSNGDSALHVFATSPDGEKYFNLLQTIAKESEVKLNVNMCDKNNETPVFLALRHNNPLLARKLIEFGALVDQYCINEQEQGPIHVAIENIKDETELCELLKILIKEEANIKLPDIKGNIPTGLAYKHNKEKAAKILKDALNPSLSKTASIYFAAEKLKPDNKCVKNIVKYFSHVEEQVQNNR